MNAIDFCFWLRGYVENGGNPVGMTTEDVDILKTHLNLVFEHEIDPLKEKEAQVLRAGPHEAHNSLELLLPYWRDSERSR